MDIFNTLGTWENLAVVLAIAYLLLAIRENSYCWYAAFISTAIYTLLFWNVSLLMESALNVYYMGMAVYGWWQWQKGGAGHKGVNICRWPVTNHILLIMGIVLVSAISGLLLDVTTSAAWPYLDSFTTWASVATTWMVARKILENWLYWIVIDALSIVLYLDRGMEATALLFAGYVVIAGIAYLQWRKHYNRSDKTLNDTQDAAACP